MYFYLGRADNASVVYSLQSLFTYLVCKKKMPLKEDLIIIANHEWRSWKRVTINITFFTKIYQQMQILFFQLGYGLQNEFYCFH